MGHGIKYYTKQVRDQKGGESEITISEAEN